LPKLNKLYGGCHILESFQDAKVWLTNKKGGGGGWNAMPIKMQI
jgi:hypothetical protein